MIASFILRLIIPKAIRFQSFSGFAARGMFFEMIKMHSEEHADKLHSTKGLAPYSMSPLQTVKDNELKVVYREVRFPTIGFIRITCMESSISRLMHDIIIVRKLRAVNLKGVTCNLAEVAVSMFDPSKALEMSRPISKFSLNFRTPTVFRLTPRGPIDSAKSNTSPQRLYPLPDPVLLVRSVVRLWRNFLGHVPFSKSFLEWLVNGGIAISGFPKGIRTYRLYEHPESNKWIVGFTGTVNYVLPPDTYEEKHAKALDALLKLAEYTNMGVGRTAGFGMVNYSVLG